MLCFVEGSLDYQRIDLDLTYDLRFFMLIGLNKLGRVLKSFEKVIKRVSNVLKTGAGLGNTNLELHVKYGLSPCKLLSWLLNILNIFFIYFFIKESGGTERSPCCYC